MDTIIRVMFLLGGAYWAPVIDEAVLSTGIFSSAAT